MTAPDVDAYLAALDDERRQALWVLRQFIRAILSETAAAERPS
jgi:hypothetical protein